jgi:nucleotidyltransferase substrate binding protein (TIGR01987 family)
MNDIRWKQRFANFERAFKRLEEASNRVTGDWLQVAGLIQTFEFTFELGWKTLKDFMLFRGEDVKFPRDVIKIAFQKGLIADGHVWISMLEKRNELSHTYNDKQALIASDLIRHTYFRAIEQVYRGLKEKEESEL